MFTQWYNSLNFSTELIFSSVGFSLLTLLIYQISVWLQNKWQTIWLNPLLMTIVCIVPILVYNQIDYQSYRQATNLFHLLLEPATVALGFPLYQQINTIKFHWKHIVLLLALGVVIALTLSFIISILLISQPEIAIALSLKSVTTPVGIVLTEQLSGDSSITPFAIMIAGFSGAILGPSWLKLINVHSKIATGLSIGAASHVIGNIMLARKDPSIAAYSSLALILSAVLTGFIAPLLIPLLLRIF